VAFVALSPVHTGRRFCCFLPATLVASVDRALEMLSSPNYSGTEYKNANFYVDSSLRKEQCVALKAFFKKIM